MLKMSTLVFDIFILKPFKIYCVFNRSQQCIIVLCGSEKFISGRNWESAFESQQLKKLLDVVQIPTVHDRREKMQNGFETVCETPGILKRVQNSMLRHTVSYVLCILVLESWMIVENTHCPKKICTL